MPELGLINVQRVASLIGAVVTTVLLAVAPVHAHDLAAGGSPSGGPATTGNTADKCKENKLKHLPKSDTCTHGADPAPPGIDISQTVPPLTASQTANPAVACVGDGISGARTEVLYVRSSDVPDRYSMYAASIRQWAADADAIYRQSAARSGGTRAIRFVHDSACVPIVKQVVLSAAGDDDFDTTVSELKALGYDNPDRKYMLFVDANVYCGLGGIWGDERPGSENWNNLGPSYGRTDSGCWTGWVVAHEHMHNLGGVQLGAPNASGGWHCTDEYDVMCYSDEPNYPVMRDVCPWMEPDLFDCGHDDYFSTAAPAGSYLATHWNAAENRFLERMDAVAPTVAGTTPVAGATNVAVGTAIQVRFSEPMNRPATESAFSLRRSSDGAPVGVSFSWSGETMTAKPAGDLQGSTAYAANVGTGARDLAGNPLAAATSWGFMTGGSNLVANPSFEAGTAGWGSFQGSLSRVALTGAPDAGHVAKAAWATGTLYSISDEQGGAKPTVSSTTAGTTYVATAYVRAATSSSAGKPVQIILRERNSSGAVIRETSTTATLGTSFARIAVAAAAAGSGNTLGLRIVQSSAASGNAFYTDLITVRRASTVLGDTTAGSVWTNAGPNAKRASRFSFTAPSTVDLAEVRAYVDGRGATSGSQPLRAVLYADSAGSPSGLVGRSNEVTIAAGRAPGWVTFKLAAPLRINAGSYWVGLHSGGSTAVARYASTSAAGALRFNSDAYSDGASNPFGTANTDAKRTSLYAIGG